MINFLPEFSFLIPFLFTFAVTFGVLSTLKNTDKDGKLRGEFMPKNVNVIIAVIFGLATAYYDPFAELIMKMLPVTSVIVVVLFLFILMKKIFENEVGDAVPQLAFLAIFILAVGTFYPQLILISGFDYSLSKDMLWIVGLLAVAALFYVGYKK